MTDTTPSSSHAHDITTLLDPLRAADAAQVAAIVALADRVAALEGVTPPPPPPVDPPPIVIPFPGFAKAEAAVSPGGVVEVPAGHYVERFTLSKPGVTWRLATGAVIDLSSLAIPIQQGGVVIKGDDIKFIGDGEVMGSAGSAIVVDGNRVTFTGHLHHNVEEGYVWHGSDGRMLGGSNHHNNETGAMWDSSEQGSGKANCTGLLIDGVHVHDIGLGGANAAAGQGLWYDRIGTVKGGGEVRNCVVERCFYSGIFYEIQDSGKLHDNVIHHCGTTPSGSGFWGAGLLSASSRNVDIYGNLFAFNKWNGVRVNCQNRSDRPGDTVNVAVHDNTFIGNGLAFGFDTDNATVQAAMFAAGSGNVAHHNRFDVPKAFWKPQGTLTTLAAINALPGGGGSTVLTAAEVSSILAQHGIVA